MSNIVTVVTTDPNEILITYEAPKTVAVSSVGTQGIPGPGGNSGLSAYQIAVLNGFVGSQSVWLASLKGNPGDPGPASTVPGPPGDASTVAGPRGSLWTTGTGAPSASANDGDQYLNTTNGDVYARVAGAWTKTGNIRGADGAGSVSTARTISTGAALSLTDRFVNYAGAGAASCTLPNIAGKDGVQITIKKTGTGVLTINGFNSGQTIDEGLTAVLSYKNGSVNLFSLSEVWLVW